MAFYESPMLKILERKTQSARLEADDLQCIIDEEEAARSERIEERIRPILVNEFRRVAKRYKVDKIIFGNGTCCVVWGDKRMVAEYHKYDHANPSVPYSEYPKGLRRLVALCDAVASTYPTFDITAEDLK